MDVVVSSVRAYVSALNKMLGFKDAREMSETVRLAESKISVAQYGSPGMALSGVRILIAWKAAKDSNSVLLITEMYDGNFHDVKHFNYVLGLK